MANTDILSNLEHFGQNISVRGADLWYGDFHAIRDISVDIPARQVTAFIGPSGCGKSTFLKCFNRMNDLVDGCRVSGDFRIGDVDIYGKIDINDLRRNVGMVFQKPNPFPMSVYDNIAYGPRTFGIRKRALLDCPAVSSSGSASRVPLPSSPASCSWMSRPAPLTPSPPARSRSFAPSCASPPPSSSSPTICSRQPVSPIKPVSSSSASWSSSATPTTSSPIPTTNAPSATSPVASVKRRNVGEVPEKRRGLLERSPRTPKNFPETCFGQALRSCTVSRGAFRGIRRRKKAGRRLPRTFQCPL